MVKGGLVAATVAVVACVTGCATVVEGTAVAPPSASPVPRVRIPAGLDTGDVPTTPYVPKQGDVDTAWAAEGNRMAESIVLPADIDPALTAGVEGLTAVPAFGSYNYPALPEKISTMMVYAKVRVTVARGDRATDPTKQLRIGLYRYADEDEAAKNDKQIPYELKDYRALTVAGATFAAEVTPGTVIAFRRVGELWLHVQATASDTATATTLVQRGVAKQVPRTESFAPTPVAALLKLPVDRDGIMTRTLGAAKVNGFDTASIGFLTWPTIERRTSDPVALAAFRDAGVDLVGWNLGVVVRTRDAASAGAYLNARVAAYGGTTVPGVPQLPDAVRCIDNAKEHVVFCYVTVGRYVARVYGDSAVLARQRAAAQWVILAGAR